MLRTHSGWFAYHPRRSLVRRSGPGQGTDRGIKTRQDMVRTLTYTGATLGLSNEQHQGQATTATAVQTATSRIVVVVFTSHTAVRIHQPSTLAHHYVGIVQVWGVRCEVSNVMMMNNVAWPPVDPPTPAAGGLCTEVSPALPFMCLTPWHTETRQTSNVTVSFILVVVVVVVDGVGVGCVTCHSPTAWCSPLERWDSTESE